VVRTPIDVANRKQLFIDQRFIVESNGIKQTVNQPKLASVAIEPGPAEAWDDGIVGGYGQVFEEDGRLRQYFSCRSARRLAGQFDAGGDASVHLCYAESTDGVRWTKPNLGVFEYNGSRDNNITCPDAGYVMADPKGRPGERYKLMCCAYAQIGAKNIFDALQPDTGGLYFYTSPDGLHWTWRPRRVLGLYPDSANQIDYDERIGKYVAYVRTWPDGFFRPRYTYGRAVGRAELDDPMHPWPYDKVSPGFRPWGPQRIATISKEVPTVLAYPGYADEGHWTDIYNPALVQYPWADDVYLAFPSLNHIEVDSPIPNHSRLEIGLAVSRDGIAWTWPSVDPYIPFGPPDTGRGGMLYMHVGLARRGDEVYQYHMGTDIEHHGQVGKVYGLEGCRNSGRVYRMVQRLDGFVSVDFPGAGGSFTTPPVRFAGRELHLNASAAGGELRVAVQDPSGRPAPGLEADACDVIAKDAVDLRVSWKDPRDLEALSGQPIRLRFQGRSAKLFAFQFR